MTPLVVYHGNCFDGHTSAWVFDIFWKKGKKNFQNQDPDFFAAYHGTDELPDTRGRHVWYLDFSYSRDAMKQLIIASKKTVVFDHHKTNEARLHNLIQEIRDETGLPRKQDKIVFDMNRSGAGITFDELEREHGLKHGGIKPRYNGERANWVVDYIEDRDIWNNKLPGTEEFTAYAATLDMTFDAWDDLLGTKASEVIKRGKYIKSYIDQYGKKARKLARFEWVGDHKVPTINIPYMNCSEHLNLLADQYSSSDFSVGYFRRLDGKWQVSLRSIGDFDVSEIATKYGGGGHKNAAGFEVVELPWTKNVK